MIDVFDVAKTLVNHVKSNYPNDVALVAYYGSYAQGTATKRSDLDFFFIPTSQYGYGASLQFVLDDISFDFWPISWERAERMAAFQEPTTTIIADCRVLYVRCEEDLKRFEGLRDTIDVMRSYERRKDLRDRAESHLRNAFVHLAKLNLADSAENISFFRIEAHGVAANVLQCLALLNGGYFTRSFGRNMEEILQLPLKPAGLAVLIETLITGSDSTVIRDACTSLTRETLHLYLAQRKNDDGPSSYPDRMKGYYEEIKGTLDKILTACETLDYPTAYFAAIHAQDEIARFLAFADTGRWPSELDASLDYQQVYARAGLPNLIERLSPTDFEPVRTATERLSLFLEDHLRRHGVCILGFMSLEDLTRFLERKP